MSYDTTKSERIDSIDAVRGLVILLMALDHAKDFVLGGNIDAENLEQTDALLFATRWITHLCAPAFCFLAGTGAALSLMRGMSVPKLQLFLLTRGLWLVFLELTLVNFGWTFFVGPPAVALAVIWMLGISMLILAALIRLPVRLLVLIAATTILAHNLLDIFKPEDFGKLSWLWEILHGHGVIMIGDEGFWILASYPLIPWFAVMLAGYLFGKWLNEHPLSSESSRALLSRIGVCLLAAFFLLRFANVYGDPAPWGVQESGVKTVISFLLLTKYPPSLEYLLITLGVMFFLLRYFDGQDNPLKRVFVVFGRVPMFFYLLHIPLLHIVGAMIYITKYGAEEAWLLSGFRSHPEYGSPLWAVYLVWLLGCLALFPLCRKWSDVKRRRNVWWLRYL